MEEGKKPNMLNQQPPPIKDQFTTLGQSIRQWFHWMFDLQEGLDREGTIISIKNNKKMQGANAWMLGCSIMIASLGLDLNSPAVIIGAMLVSPLMSPILGIGLGVGTNDKDTLFGGLRHFGIAILIALVTSTFYFFVTPFGQVTSEIQSRTSPTVLDGLVAVFGGLAGIISITRKDKSNAIPGVAIATALMPPLCVTGFGLAELMELIIQYQFQYEEMTPSEFEKSLTTVFGIIWGSFYLFFLNSFFIALTTYIIIRLMRFPLRSFVNPKEARRNRFILMIFSIIIILPSTGILWQLYHLQQDKQQVKEFINDYFPEACIKHELSRVNQDSNKLIVQLLGKRIKVDNIQHFEAILMDDYHLNKPVRLIPMQAELSMEDLKNSLQEQRNEVVNMLEIERKEAEKIIREREVVAQNIRKISSDSAKMVRGMRLAKEAFPDDLLSINYTDRLYTLKDTTKVLVPPAFILEWRRKKDTKENIDQLQGILKVGTELDTFRMINY